MSLETKQKQMESVKVRDRTVERVVESAISLNVLERWNPVYFGRSCFTSHESSRGLMKKLMTSTHTYMLYSFSS